MASIATCTVSIALPRATVWAGLRDFGRAPLYVPGLTGAVITTEAREGVGASRRVYQRKGPPLDETVVSWDEGAGFTLRLHRGAKPMAPFKEAWFDYRIGDGPNGTTVFSPALRYTMPLGRVGALLDRLVVHRAIAANVRAVAESFKRHYETGEITNPDYQA